VLVTAGPTREHIDPVRYLSNESSGRMGFEIAAAAARRGDRVTLVAGPVGLPTPPGVERIAVVSAREMLSACLRAFGRADALFMCAAVADWRPSRRKRGKWRKEGESKEVATIELRRNPDIVATLARRSRGGRARFLLGFALETGRGETRARAKLRRKGLDYIVLNDERALGGERTSVSILGRDGSIRRLSRRSKRSVAEVLVALPLLGSVRSG